MHNHRCRHLAILLTMILIQTTRPVVGAAQPEDEPDDRLSPKNRRLVAGWIRHGIPKKIEKKLRGHPLMHQIYVARGYTRAGIQEKSPARREALLTQAAKVYRQVSSLGHNHRWLRGRRRRFHVAQWNVEFADMILRHWIAADLDRFEITSGLEFDRDKLTSRLREARKVYAEAGTRLRELDRDLRSHEERYLLLGIADKIPDALSRQKLNAAWAELYMAVVGKEDAGKNKRLNRALEVFGVLFQSSQDEGRKYNALLGAGIALRELARFDEAEDALQGVINSTAAESAKLRAQFELARSFLRAKHYEQARETLDQLSQQSLGKPTGPDDLESFYVRLAPLIHGYTYLRESKEDSVPIDRRKQLAQRASDELVALSKQGGAWPMMVRVYLDRLSGAQRNLEELTDEELILSATHKMSDQHYHQAAKAWQILLNRPDAAAHHHQARLNLGVCYFQKKNLRAAAQLFLEEAHLHPPSTIAPKVIEYSYRCWHQIAAAGKKREDYLKLAEAADILAKTLPKSPYAAEAGWVAALALEEAGDYQEAARAYARISKKNPNYWQAQWNLARCGQRIYETLPDRTTAFRRRNYARRAAEAWLHFAEALSTSKTATHSANHRPDGHDGSSNRLLEARLAAATLLAGDDLRDYESCLKVLGAMTIDPQVMGLRVRCLQGLGRLEEANYVIQSYLEEDTGQEVGSVLLNLAAEMESQIKRLETSGRHRQAKRMANKTVPTIQQLLRWIRSHPEYQSQIRIVQFSLAKTFIQADRQNEAMGQLEQLMNEAPDNGVYVRTAARLQEDLAHAAPPADQARLLERSESLWAQLLNDSSLRQNAPQTYWEARYHWLKLQLRHPGRASNVLRGIESEKAWYPKLGGPPWRGRLLQLAEKAREMTETTTP